MLTHPLFSEYDTDFWKEFVERHPLALLVHFFEGAYFATHIPIILLRNSEGREVLAGHLPLANPQAGFIRQGLKAMAVFSTPAAYVSGAWYEEPSVSTMNYEAVHIQGALKETSPEHLKTILREMNDRLENMYNPGSPLRLDQLSPEYLEANYRVLMGFEMQIEKVEAARKLSQNKSSADRQRILWHLLQRGRPEDMVVSDAMKNREGLEPSPAGH